MKKLIPGLTLGLLVLTACMIEVQNSATPRPSTAATQPTATAVWIVPTPSSPGDSVTWDDLQVTMVQAEVTQDYVTDFGSLRVPPDGYHFLWVQVKLQNTGQIERTMPVLENFSVLSAGSELKPTYGHRSQYGDYSALGTTIFPGQELSGWLRFDIPNAAALSDLLFVFLPESAQVGASYGSPGYPYAANKPTYVWNVLP